MKFSLIIAALMAGASADEPCCLKCPEGFDQYYSIDHIFNHCGESCIKPSEFWLYKLFEPGLAQDNSTDIPCANRGYSLYYETETHGVWPVTATVDLYNPGAELILKQQAEMKDL